MNYYEILEITENASQEVVKAAYRALAKKYHPDSYSGTESEREKSMTLINEAYEVLSDDQKRKEYDLKLKSQNSNKNSFHNEKKAESQQDTSYERQKHSSEYQNDQSRYSESNLNEAQEQYEYNSYDSKCQDAEEPESSSLFGKIFRGIGKEIVYTIQSNNREMENAYLNGLSMDDYTLVRRFKQAKGPKRAGYAKALEEKDLLARDYDGKLVPTYKFKCMF